MNCPHCQAPLAADARFCGACGRASVGTAPSQHAGAIAAPAATGDLVGREIGGRYRVFAKLGEGGMGAVYRGEQISLKRKVAIKVLRPELSADAGLVRRFNAEAELCAKLSHPNTVGIYDFGQDTDGSLYIAMELLEGRSLRQVMAEGAMPPGRAIYISQQIARSLADAHAHGIVHRDLKPDNVMLTERGRERDVVRVLDFGIAKLRDDNKATVNHMTRAGDLIGTPQYMAPEQIRGEHVDGRTDIYALGSMIYEMLTGRLPFEGTTVMAILSKHLTENPLPPSQRRPELHLPPMLDGLVMAAMAKDPAQRPPSMEAIGEHLDAIAAQLGGGSGASASWSYSQPAPIGAAPPTPPPSGSYPPPSGNYPPPSYPPGPQVAPIPSPPPAGYPIGAATPPPYGAPPSYGAPTPPPYGAPTPPPYGPPMTTMAGGRSSWTPILALVGVLAAGGAAAAVYFATRGSESSHAQPGPGPGPGSDPWEHPGSNHGSDDPWANGGGSQGGSDVVYSPSGDWTSFESPDNRWTIALPPGLPATPSISNPSTGIYSFSAMVGGSRVEAGVMASTAPVDLSMVSTDQMATALANQLNATVVESGTAMTGDVSTPRVVLRAATFGQGEGRFFTTDDDYVVFAYYATTGDWDATAALRRTFFERVIVE